MQKLKNIQYWLNMLILNHFRLSFDKINEKCGGNLHEEAVVMIYFKLFRRMQKLKKYWLNMLILNHFRLSFDKTNEKCGDNLHGEAFVRIYFEEYKKD